MKTSIFLAAIAFCLEKKQTPIPPQAQAISVSATQQRREETFAEWSARVKRYCKWIYSIKGVHYSPKDYGIIRANKRK